MVKITAVEPHSKADAVGIEAGDVLVSVNGNDIHDVLDYRFYLTERVAYYNYRLSAFLELPKLLYTFLLKLTISNRKYLVYKKYIRVNVYRYRKAKTHIHSR